MTEEFHQQIGKMVAALETNTRLTERVADSVGKIETHLATLNGKVAGHDKYLENLDGRVVENRKGHEELMQEMSYFKGAFKGAAKFAGALWGTISAIIVGLVTHFTTK